MDGAAGKKQRPVIYFCTAGRTRRSAKEFIRYCFSAAAKPMLAAEPLELVDKSMAGNMETERKRANVRLELNFLREQDIHLVPKLCLGTEFWGEL